MNDTFMYHMYQYNMNTKLDACVRYMLPSFFSIFNSVAWEATASITAPAAAAYATVEKLVPTIATDWMTAAVDPAAPMKTMVTEAGRSRRRAYRTKKEEGARKKLK